ncbi:MAG: hypothetical protein WD794_09530 [Mycobacteriales bacterium]
MPAPSAAPADTGREAQVWGRVPGRRPPLPAWAPLAWFVALAVVLTFVVVTLVRPPGLLDDPDPAYQRDGLLLNGPVLPEQVAGVGFGGRAVVLLFVRDVPPADELAEWAAAVPEPAELRVVLPAPATDDLPVPTVADPRNRLAAAVDMPDPADGGRPVGYAVVDADRVVRYATLDPDYLANAFEVTTIVGAVT